MAYNSAIKNYIGLNIYEYRTKNTILLRILHLDCKALEQNKKDYGLDKERIQDGEDVRERKRNVARQEKITKGLTFNYEGRIGEKEMRKIKTLCYPF